MSANELFEWIFDDSGLNFGSNLQNDTLSFRKTYDNSRLIDDTDNYYNVDSNDYQSIIYTDLESIFSGNSFTLSLTLFEKFDDPTKPGNLFTLGYHTKGSKNTCITVGRKANTGEVVLGTISEFTSIKGTALGSTRQISDESYEYVLVHNNLEIERNRFHLYINRTGTSDYSLICDSSGLSNISILQPKLFIGSSLWTNEPEWNNQFDLCDVTLTSNIRLTVNETIYPVDVVVVDSITEQNLDLTTPTIGNSDIYLDERFSVSFKSDFRFSPLNTFIYVTSTTDSNRIQLQHDSLMFDNISMKYEYVFNGTITDTYNSDTVISYMFNLNGTIYNNKFATVSTQLTVKSTPSSPPTLPPPTLPTSHDYTTAGTFDWPAPFTGIITVELQGGNGGKAVYVNDDDVEYHTQGGTGGYVSVNVNVVKDTSYQIVVAARGGDYSGRSGGGGGGASGFSKDGVWMVIAGGGGGAGGDNNGRTAAVGGSGGNPLAWSGQNGGSTGNGTGGTTTQPGAAGTGRTGKAGVAGSGHNGGRGAGTGGPAGGTGVGNGGNGGLISGDDSGGGGGGGWYGGGGGAVNSGGHGGGGGGGSTYYYASALLTLTDPQNLRYSAATLGVGFVKLLPYIAPFVHTWTLGSSAKCHVFLDRQYNVGDYIDLDIMTDGPNPNTYNLINIQFGLTSTNVGSDTTTIPTSWSGHNSCFIKQQQANGIQIYRGDLTSENRYYDDQVGAMNPDFINHYARMTIVSGSQIEYTFYNDSTRTTLHTVDPGRTITKTLPSFPAYLFFSPEKGWVDGVVYPKYSNFPGISVRVVVSYAV
jgi:hypothetical protein